MPSKKTSKTTLPEVVARPLPINKAVNETRRAGQIFLPTDEKESAVLMSYRPTIRPSLPSIFEDARYELPPTFSEESFRPPSFRRPEVGRHPRTSYPMALVDVYPSLSGDRNMLVLAEGRLLFLALHYIDTCINDAVDEDPKTHMIMSPVKNTELFKERLDLASPALVCRPFFLFSSLIPYLFCHF